ncbi:DNA-binding transcriptional regulator, ArsR family [Mucilaginibacter pineti]|uniref:DNA-binding transcriptional regulator, ArsR family n=1 Tax=Mucilaginibacter pineti TaxID=1391627 RepID=A0A1G6UIS6_9SPHI|nr:metalloregulator ArsR/SmtB family transcription factor [Mucilaginibacter pineti]SDD41262.1 DNA-binding transcriptional regulator, ArsR family [Mucilaginibacter pineti]
MEQHRLDAFQVIADPSRRQILQLLSKDNMTINSLADNFDMSRPAVSKHIKALYNAGFISIQDIGRERHCTLKQDGFNELQEWLAYYDAFWGSKLKKLGALLNDKS